PCTRVPATRSWAPTTRSARSTRSSRNGSGPTPWHSCTSNSTETTALQRLLEQRLRVAARRVDGRADLAVAPRAVEPRCLERVRVEHDRAAPAPTRLVLGGREQS